MDVKKIGGFLKKLRQEKKVTQEQLAEIIGVSGLSLIHISEPTRH